MLRICSIITKLVLTCRGYRFLRRFYRVYVFVEIMGYFEEDNMVIIRVIIDTRLPWSEKIE